MKRFTLIIDGHNFFFRSLWSAFRQGHKNKILTSQKDVDTFEKKLMLDFCSVVKMMNPIVNDIVFVKISGHYYLHKIFATKNGVSYQISNNHWHINS